jgi:hypothetical protein
MTACSPLGFLRRVARERLGITPDEIDGGHSPALSLWVPKTMSYDLTWPHSTGPRAVGSALATRAAHARALSPPVTPAFRLPGSAANARLDGPARTVRAGQRHRDSGPAPADRRAPAPRQNTPTLLGRPRDPIRAGPADPQQAAQPAAPDRLAMHVAALARRHRQAPLVLPAPPSWTPGCPANCPRSGAGNGARQPGLGISAHPRRTHRRRLQARAIDRLEDPQ